MDKSLRFVALMTQIRKQNCRLLFARSYYVEIKIIHHKSDGEEESGTRKKRVNEVDSKNNTIVKLADNKIQARAEIKMPNQDV